MSEGRDGEPRKRSVRKIFHFNAWKTCGELANGFEILGEIHAREFSFLLVLNLFVFSPNLR